MRILQLHDEPWDSGIAHYALTLSSELKRRGHEVHFWAALGSHAAAGAREAGLETREIPQPWLCLPRLRAEIRERGIEILNAHTGSTQALAAALAWGRKLPVIRTRADARPCARHLLARALARRTQAFIAANARIRGELLEAFPFARVELVFQGIPSAPLPAAAGLPQAPVIGILGRLDPVKGHDDFMDAAVLLHKALPQARFLAAGAGKPERVSRLQWQIGYLKIDGALELLGRVEDPGAFIARCRVGVVASVDSEAVSRAALEWMAMGRPLVATSVGCLPDLVQDGETGFLVPPRDSQALAKAIKRLLENSAMAAEMGRKAKDRFEALFNLQRFAAQTESLYAEALRISR